MATTPIYKEILLCDEKQNLPQISEEYDEGIRKLIRLFDDLAQRN